MKNKAKTSFIPFTFALSLLASLSLSAQRPIDVTYVQDAQGNTVFSCNNKAFCNYVLQFNFTSLANARPDHTMPYQGVVKPGLTRLFKLSKENANTAMQFKYSINFFKGCLNPSVDTGFTYLLPIAPGKEAQAYELRNAPRSAANDPPIKTFYAIRLRMKPGDTLYAARRGTVVEVDVSSDANDQGAASSGDEDYVEIIHKDCSFGHYGVLKKDGAFVKPGQVVEAGQPIGIIGGDHYGRGSEARFNVYYNESPDMPQTGEARVGEVGRIYIPLKFWTKKNGKGMLKHGGTYTGEFPEAILTQEIVRPKPASKKSKSPAKSHS